jgi:2-phospho-L-lactate guanylyltransferase
MPTYPVVVTAHPAQPSIAALIPIKAFTAGKTRLKSALDDDQRAALAERLAAGVVAGCGAIPVHVVCEDETIAAWAREHGASVIHPPRPGLNNVVRHGVRHLADAGIDRVLIAHADLADAGALESLAAIDGVVLVPDRAKEGTNVLVVPAAAGFSFSYGPNSFARHLSEAERIGQPITVVIDEGLGLDLDDPDDLEAYAARELRG